MHSLIIVSLNIGSPVTLGDPQSADPLDQPYTTAYFKKPVSEPLRLIETGFERDGHADLRVHGGLEKAVYCYPAAHYPAWRVDLNIPGMAYGDWGENLTLEGATELGVCIGDVYACGEARLQVSQPRRPCYKMDRRWHRPDIQAHFERSGRVGWYMRVLRGGEIQAGQRLELVERPPEAWTIARAHELVLDVTADLAAAQALAVYPLLGPEYQKSFRKRLTAAGVNL